VIRTLHPPGGRELFGSDFTAIRFDILPPILTAPHRAMNFASAIKATVRGGTDISARRGRTQRTGGTLMLRVIVLAESGQLTVFSRRSSRRVTAAMTSSGGSSILQRYSSSSSSAKLRPLPGRPSPLTKRRSCQRSITAWLTPPSMLRWWTGNRGGGGRRQGGKEGVDL
jgi:hypothetical protein